MKLSNFHILIKKTFYYLLETLDFWQIVNSPLNKGKSTILPLSSGSEFKFFTYDIAKLFPKNFCNSSHLEDSGISLLAFPSTTNLKLYISVIPKIAKKVILTLDSSKASSTDCILVVVLKNCELELSCVLAELFSIFLKKSCFLHSWKIVSVVPLFKNVGERSTAKNYHSVSLLRLVNKFCEKHVSNRLLDDLEKCGLFSGFQYGFRSSQSTVDFLTVASERITRASSRSRAT